MREFQKGDYVKVTGLPGRAGNIEDVDEDEIFIGMYGTVTSSAWHLEEQYEGIVQVELDNGQGHYWWQEESLELVLESKIATVTAEDIRKEFLQLLSLSD